MRDRLKRILCLILTLAAAAGLMLVRDSAAWFNTETGTPIGQSIQIKKMSYTFTGSLGSAYRTNRSSEATEFMITDVNLITGNGKISCTNNSAIETEMRVQIKYGPFGGSGSEETFNPTAAGGSVTTDAQTGGKIMKDAKMELHCPSTWTFSDGYLVYSSGGSARIPARAANAAAVRYDILTYLAFSEEKMDSAYTASTLPASCPVTVTVQARQADIMIWEDVATIYTEPVSP